MDDRSKPQLFPNPYPSRPCEVYLCTRRADYYLGRPDGPLSIVFPICGQCAEDALNLLPEELKPAPVVTEPEVPTDKVPCSKCGGLYSTKGIKMHEQHCKLPFGWWCR